MSGVLTVVVAHVKRTHYLDELAEKVDAAYVFVDNGSLGEWSNHERALRWAAGEAASRGLSHVCVMQDDALPVDMFIAYVNALAIVRPDDMIGLYVGTHRPHRDAVTTACAQADEQGAMFLSYHELCWGVATLMPAAAIEPMLEHAVKSNRPYDLRLGRSWAKVMGEQKPVLYTHPSLVDHRDDRSVIAGRTMPQGVRHARRTGPLGGDPNVVVPIVTTAVRSAERRRNRKNTVT